MIKIYHSIHFSDYYLLLLTVITFIQIEAADKQLRATRRFLDEQASEREMERDEAAKQIQILQEQLKERERKKERDIRISCEVKLFLETFNFLNVIFC